MPYALFCNDAKLSKAYPTEADVWKLAAEVGSWSMRYPRKTGRRHGRFWTMIMRSGRAGRIRRKIPSRIRPTRSAKPSTNYNLVLPS